MVELIMIIIVIIMIIVIIFLGREKKLTTTKERFLSRVFQNYIQHLQELPVLLHCHFSIWSSIWGGGDQFHLYWPEGDRFHWLGSVPSRSSCSLAWLRRRNPLLPGQKTWSEKRRKMRKKRKIDKNPHLPDKKNLIRKEGKKEGKLKRALSSLSEKEKKGKLRRALLSDPKKATRRKKERSSE